MIEPILLVLSMLLLIVAGLQDFKTRKPTALIPALILMGFAINIFAGILIGIFALISLYALPDKVNETMGKADIFLLGSLIILMLMANSLVFMRIIIFACLIISILGFYYIKKKPKEMLPLVGLFAMGFFGGIIIDMMLYLVGF